MKPDCDVGGAPTFAQPSLVCKTTESENSPISVNSCPPAPFIVGAERSGTTMLRLMLDSHPDLAIPSETHFIPRILRTCVNEMDSRSCMFDAITARTRWVDFHLDRDVFLERLAQIEPFTIGGGIRTFYELYAEKCGKARWGDKTPPYVSLMTPIQEVLPEARFIHIIRDGRDVALSHRPLWFGPASIDEAATWWTKVIRKARRQADGLSFYMEVRYEDLVLDTPHMLRHICDFLDLRWDPSVLDFHRRAEQRISEIEGDMTAADGSRVVHRDQRRSLHQTTMRPPDPSRIARWRSEMSVSDRTRFQAIGAKTLQSLGYEID